jgi:hypothetical protein
MKTKAVIDRFEEDIAVLIVGEDRLNVPRASLPPGVKEGQWLQIELEGKRFISAVMDDEETTRVKKRIAEKRARLKRGDHLKE